MSRTGFRRWSALATLATAGLLAHPQRAVAQAAPAQKMDAEYTAKIKEYLTDPRITTELVDHLPASTKVPTPLKFLGRIVGTPGELTHAKDIHRYLKAVADAAPMRAKYWTIGKSEEGRDIVVLVVGNEETIRNLNTYKGYLAELTDSRKTTEARARTLIKTAKPIYYITSGMHSPETGGPEMLMELAYRLVVEETPFIQDIRNNVITMITPVVEVDGREKIVDNCYMQANLGYGPGQPYWGKYVQHDNNRDGMGQFLQLTQAVEKLGLEWHPTILHDLHEAQTLLYASTGTGPYNEQLDPITVDEWWMMAENDVMEMTKRGVPGVWTYGFYDGWVPNYMFYVVHAHNAIGRFYEVQSYSTGCAGLPGSATQLASVATAARLRAADSAAAAAAGATPGAGGGGRGGFGGGGGRGGRGAANQTPDSLLTRVLGGSNYAQSREWFRPNPTPDDIKWGNRANTNIQESAILFALKNTGHDRERFLENYWIKGKNAVARGKNGPIKAWVIPATQHSKANAAEAVNELLDQGLEFHVADADFTAGSVSVKKGDWIVRGDQPFRTVADIYFSVQNFPTTNPSPYDDTGWTYQMMRNLIINEVGDASILNQPMTQVMKHVTAPGGIIGQAGSTIIIDHTGDNNMMAFRFRFPGIPMTAAEAAFDANGHHFGAGSFIIHDAGNDRANVFRAQIEPALRELSLSGYAVEVPATVKTHDLDVPRIGYIHSWSRTQDEGWVRAAMDYYKVPYTYFGENAVPKMGRLRDKFDVILWPHGGAVGTPTPTYGQPIPYKSTKEYPALGHPDSTDDTRGGLGDAGLKMLQEFMQQGGTIITEGGTASLFTVANMTPGIKIAPAPGLVDRGTILRNVIVDMNSPIVYGLSVNQLPVYFSGGAILDVGILATPDAPAQGKVNELRPGSRAATGGGGGGRGGAGGGAGGRGGAPNVYQNTQPMATWLSHAVWDPMEKWPQPPAITTPVDGGPRVVMTFPASPKDMLLSGVLSGGENLSNRGSVIDEPIGQGHLVMFAIRPFWRWQTQGTFILGFNSILNWNDLNAGR
jgi:hypothetical protein